MATGCRQYRCTPRGEDGSSAEKVGEARVFRQEVVGLLLVTVDVRLTSCILAENICVCQSSSISVLVDSENWVNLLTVCKLARAQYLLVDL